MTPRNAAIAGITLAAAFALAGVIFNDTHTAEAGPLRDAVQLNEVVLHSASVRFLPDAGCLMRVQASHEPADDVVVSLNPGDHPFNGARCDGIRLAAAKAVAKDIGRDAGAP